MSYCRWSSDRFQCDVYCYEDIYSGYTIHVASRRIVLDGTEPVQVAFDPENLDKFMEYENAFSEWMDKANRVNINLPHDGKSFNFWEPGECADKLEELRNIGYNVPQYAIDALREEQLEFND